MTATTRALWYPAPGRAALLEESLPAPGPGEVLVRTLYSGVSRGTERLVCLGRVPVSERERMRGPHMAGAFTFPVKYGYCAVGVVEAGVEALIGRRVFVLHPHQECFVVAAEAVTPVPDTIPPARATLTANMETALNALWDGGAGPGDRILVVGAGIVGLLVAAIAQRLPAADVTVVDPVEERRAIVELLGARFAQPEDAPAGQDVAFHASASAAGLAVALEALGVEGALVELSWYGVGEVQAPLGGAFHSRRLRLISSQVGMVSPGRRPRWDYARRKEAAMRLLEDARLDALVGETIAFEDAPHRLPAALAPGAPGLPPVIRYG